MGDVTQAPAPAQGDTARELARQVLIHGPIARAELARRLGLSPASVTRLSRPFLERGFLVETDAVDRGGAHRPTRPLDVRVDAARFLGVKITADTITGVITDMRCTPLAEASAALESVAPDDVVASIAALAHRLDDAAPGAPIAGLGACLGGRVVAGGVVERAPYQGWRSVPLGQALEAATGLPTTVDNDVAALTVAEQWFGPFRDEPSFAVVTVGVGVGYGLVTGGKVLRTADTGLGTAGHLPLFDDGPPCAEGHRGCTSGLLTSGAIAASASARLAREVSYDDVLALARAGDTDARTVVDASGRGLGRLLAQIVTLAMCDAVVLTGEGMALWDVAEQASREQLAVDRHPGAAHVRIEVDRSGTTAWARGAAATSISAALDALRLGASTAT